MELNEQLQLRTADAMAWCIIELCCEKIAQFWRWSKFNHLCHSTVPNRGGHQCVVRWQKCNSLVDTVLWVQPKNEKVDFKWSFHAAENRRLKVWIVDMDWRKKSKKFSNQQVIKFEIQLKNQSTSQGRKVVAPDNKRTKKVTTIGAQLNKVIGRPGTVNFLSRLRAITWKSRKSHPTGKTRAKGKGLTEATISHHVDQTPKAGEKY